MAMETISFDYDELAPDLKQMEECVINITEALSKAMAQINNLTSQPNTQDRTAATVLAKLQDMHARLKDAPQAMMDLNASLKKKSEELSEATDVATHGIENI